MHSHDLFTLLLTLSHLHLLNAKYILRAQAPILTAAPNIFLRQIYACATGQISCFVGGGCCDVGALCTSSDNIPICQEGCGVSGQTCTGFLEGLCCQVGYTCDYQSTLCISNDFGPPILTLTQQSPPAAPSTTIVPVSVPPSQAPPTTRSTASTTSSQKPSTGTTDFSITATITFESISTISTSPSTSSSPTSHPSASPSPTSTGHQKTSATALGLGIGFGLGIIFSMLWVEAVSAESGEGLARVLARREDGVGWQS